MVSAHLPWLTSPTGQEAVPVGYDPFALATAEAQASFAAVVAHGVGDVAINAELATLQHTVLSHLTTNNFHLV